MYFGELNLLPFLCAPWVCAFYVAASLFGKDQTVPLIRIFILASAACPPKFPVATMPSPIVKYVCVCGFFSVTCILCHRLVMDKCWTTTGAPNKQKNIKNQPEYRIRPCLVVVILVVLKQCKEQAA